MQHHVRIRLFLGYARRRMIQCLLLNIECMHRTFRPDYTGQEGGVHSIARCSVNCRFPGFNAFFNEFVGKAENRNESHEGQTSLQMN